MVRHPRLRRATVRAARPPAKVGWRLGKAAGKRKARRQVQQVGGVSRIVGAAAQVYGPMAAQVLGRAQAPKPKRRLPAFAAGLAIGAGAAYLVARTQGG